MKGREGEEVKTKSEKWGRKTTPDHHREHRAEEENGKREDE
jgi:hypothetical protein